MWGMSERLDLSWKRDSSVLGVGSSAAGELALDGEERDCVEDCERGGRVGMFIVNGEGTGGVDLGTDGNGGGWYE